MHVSALLKTTIPFLPVRYNFFSWKGPCSKKRATCLKFVCGVTNLLIEETLLVPNVYISDSFHFQNDKVTWFWRWRTRTFLLKPQCYYRLSALKKMQNPTHLLLLLFQHIFFKLFLHLFFFSCEALLLGLLFPFSLLFLQLFLLPFFLYLSHYCFLAVLGKTGKRTSRCYKLFIHILHTHV